jgi:8-oxo-dGTP pyrophosphatase MutT (NUDIX family)
MPRSYFILHDGYHVLVGAGGNSKQLNVIQPRPGIHLPGGAIDTTANPSETPIIAAFRECKEETGISFTWNAAGEWFVSTLANPADIPIHIVYTTFPLPSPNATINFVVMQISLPFFFLLGAWQRPVTIHPEDEPFTAVTVTPFLYAHLVFNAFPGRTDWFAMGLVEARNRHLIAF